MSVLRKYELYIGKASSDKKIIQQEYLYSQQKALGVKSEYSNDVIPPAGQFIKITDLQMTADIKYSKDAESILNTQIKITILNPNSNTLSYIREGYNVVLNAGYTNDATLSTLCVCQIIKAVTRRKGTDVEVEIICSDSGSLKKGVYYTASYPAGTLYTSIVGDFIDCYKNNGVALGRFDVSKMEGKTLKASIAFEGLASVELSKFLSNMSPPHKTYTTVNRVFVVPKQSEELVDVVLLTEDDFKSSVELLVETSGTKAEKKREFIGKKINIFLNGACSTSGYVRILTGEHAGDYIIKTATHSLNYEGSNWDTTLEIIN